MKKLSALFLAIVMLLSLVACGNQQDNQKDSETPPSVNDPVNAPENVSGGDKETEQSSDSADEVNNEVVEYYLNKSEDVKVTDTHVIFTDDGSGEEMSVAKNPKKVAVLFGSMASLWYEAGGTVQIGVGGESAITTYKEQIGRDITQDEGFVVVTESSSGTNWDVETIIAEEPDLIVCSVGMKGYSTISGPAAAAGIPVIGINYDSVQDYLKWFKVFCNLNSKPELWDEVAEKTANDIIDIVSKVPEVEKAPTAIILVISSGKLRAYSLDSQPGVMLNELGGINVLDPNGEGFATTDINVEEIYALDPDIIFLSGFGDVTMDTLLEMQKDNPVWDSLRAVKDGKLYFLDKSLFHNKANHLYNESYRTMAQYLYPDVEF